MSFVSRVKGILGGSKTDTSHRGAPQITPDSVPHGALADVWTLHDSRMPETPKRIQDAIDFLTDKKRAPMPPEFVLEERDAMRGSSELKFRRVREECARLSAKVPRIKRPKAGESNAAKRASTRIEQFAEGVLGKKYAYRSTVMTLKVEGELFLFAYPSPASWKYIPTIFDEDQQEGPHLTEDQYGQVPEARRGEYERFDMSVTDEPQPQDEGAAMLAQAMGTEAPAKPEPTTSVQPRYKRLSQRYRVDAEGNPDDGSDTFTVDREQSNQFYGDELAQAYGKTIPLDFELVHRQDCIPINPRFVGDRVEVDGVIRRSLFSRSELIRRRYRWAEMDEQLEPVSGRDGQNGDFWLYEYRTKDENERPFIVYQVGERQTTKDDETCVIKLWDEYGIDDMLVHYDVGDSWRFSNWDLNSIPATHHGMQDALNRDSIVTGLTMSTWVSGWPTFGQKMTSEGLALAKLHGVTDLSFSMRPNQVVPLWGELVELTSKGSNVDVKTLLMVLGENIDKAQASAGPFGGDGPTSGLDREVTGRDYDVANFAVIEASRRMYEAAGRFTLIICTALAKKAKKAIELWIMSDTTVAQTGKQTTNYSVVKLGADDCGPNFDVIAEFPNIPGENLAAASLFADLAGKGLILREEFRERWGDPSPEIFEAKLRLQRFYDSPAGQLDVMEGLATYLADDRMAKLVRLTADGKMTAEKGGAPTAGMNDLMGGGGGGGMQNPGAAALGGGNAGAMQADAASAGAPTDGMGASDLGVAA